MAKVKQLEKNKAKVNGSANVQGQARFVDNPFYYRPNERIETVIKADKR